MPKDTGGTPEQLGKMWGGVRGEEKWRPDMTVALAGWLGEGRGSLVWRDHRRGRVGVRGSRGSMPSISPAQSGPRKPAGVLGQVLHPLRPPLCHVGPRGMGGRQGEKRRGDRGWESLGLEDQRRH